MTCRGQCPFAAIQTAEEAHLNMEQHHGMVQQICHLGSSPLLTLLLFQRLTQLPSFFPDFAAQQPLIVCQLGSPGGLATCSTRCHFCHTHCDTLPTVHGGDISLCIRCDDSSFAHGSCTAYRQQLAIPAEHCNANSDLRA